ncbi:MAG TPA: hypothetical protein DEH05_16530 [Propionibacteriaceae bacterium]|nr:hypothetical protein [Propionibacteriaceae bacterium]
MRRGEEDMAVSLRHALPHDTPRGIFGETLPHHLESKMCRPVACRTCGKTTWAGCGQHVAMVKASVPASQWCSGHANEAPAASGGMFSKLFGR